MCNIDHKFLSFVRPFDELFFAVRDLRGWSSSIFPTRSSRFLRLLPFPHLILSLEKSVYEFSVKDNKGKDAPLSAYQGKVALIANVAAECGYTDSSPSLAHLTI